MASDCAPDREGLARYKALIVQFISHQISASDFQNSYLLMFKQETNFFGQHTFDVLEYLFTSADGYVADPETRRAILAKNPELRRYGQGLWRGGITH